LLETFEIRLEGNKELRCGVVKISADPTPLLATDFGIMTNIGVPSGRRVKDWRVDVQRLISFFRAQLNSLKAAMGRVSINPLGSQGYS